MSETSDMLALANNIRDNDGFFGGNGSWFFILILFFLIGGNGWNYSDRGDYATKADLYEGLNSQNTFSEFRSLQNEVTRGFSDVNQNLCMGFGNTNQNLMKGFYDESLGMANGFAGVNQGICATNSAIQSAIADTNYRMQNCCCEIKQAIASDGEATRALITQNEIQKLRDELQDEKNERYATGIVTANTIQTQNLENFARQLLSNVMNNNFGMGCGC